LIPPITLPHEVTSTIIEILLKITILLVIAYLILRVTRYTLSRLVSRNILTQNVAEQVYRPIQAIVYIFTVIAVIYIVTQTPGLAYLWIAVLVIALAANWNLLADLTSYYILLARRLRIGDYIEVNGYKGRIVAIDVFTTTIRDQQGSTITIPNRLLVSKPLRRTSRTNATMTLLLRLNIIGERDLETIESKLREALLSEKRITKPQDVETRVVSVTPSRAEIIVTINAPMLHTRAQTINTIVKSLLAKLKQYQPEIEVKTLPSLT